MLNIDKISELSALNVLCVEDDDETREELHLILQSWFDTVYMAVNGEQGLALYLQHSPNIVISDIQMPKMNGLSMSADIKQHNPQQEIILLSAYNDVEYLFRALEMGIRHYITKPISIDRLLGKLVEINNQIHLEAEAKRNHKILEQYKVLVDEKAIVAKINLQGHIDYANQQFCHLSGYSEKELLGQHYSLTFTDSTQVPLLKALKTTVLQKKKWQGILKASNKAGENYIVDITVIAITDEDDNIEEFVALLIDMTEVYEKFERLSLNLQQDLKSKRHYFQEYERAIELGTSLCVLNTEGDIISVNQNFSATLNCQKEELIGRSFCDMIQNDRNFKQRVLSQVHSEGLSTNIIHIAAKSDYERTLSTVIIGIKDEQGHLHSLMSLNQDISDSIKLSDEIIETQKELIYVMGDIVENRSSETGQHIKRVAEISQLLAEKYGLSKDHAQMIKIASPMHDIGKVGISDHILHKPGKLTESEYKTIKQHADLGYNMLNKMNRPLINMAATIAREHHEYYNGQGYPLGLVGEQISIEARIVSIVDVFDALSSKRSYKDAWKDDKIIAHLKKNSGVQFDPTLVALFLDNIEQILAIRNQLHDNQPT